MRGGRAAARGMRWPDFRDLEGWRSLLRLLAGSAREQGADLLLLPGMLGLKLLDLGRPWSFGPELSRRVAEQAGLLEEGLAIAQEVAAEFELYLAPGSFLLPAGNGGLRHEAVLFDPAGREILRTAQTHPSAREAAWGVRPGQTLELAPSPWGKIGLLVGNDAWVPEVGRILALEGAELFLAPVTRPAPYREVEQLWGTWAQVQGNQTYALECGLWGRSGGELWAHRTAALAPCELTPGETGFLVRDQEWAVADFPPQELAAVRRSYPLRRHLNLPLYRRHLPLFWREEHP